MLFNESESELNLMMPSLNKFIQFHEQHPSSIHSFAVGKLYHHSMFHNPTAAVNLFQVGKQYLTFCKA